MDKTPVYQYSADYALDHGELEQYRTSLIANQACKEAIEAAIQDNYRDNRLGKDAAKQVTEKFGFERTMYVLATTIQEKDFDGRISRDNKAWAATIPVCSDKSVGGRKRCLSYVVDAVNPGLTDIFVNQVRHDYLMTQPLTKEDIQAEAASLLRKLQAEREPNSPSGTHYMAQISPDFLFRASTKDQDKLLTMLPFRSLSFSNLKDRKGVFALISKDEDRNQVLRIKSRLSDKVKGAKQKSVNQNKSTVSRQRDIPQR